MRRRARYGWLQGYEDGVALDGADAAVGANSTPLHEDALGLDEREGSGEGGRGGRGDDGAEYGASVAVRAFEEVD